jgi:hypothetical protein
VRLARKYTAARGSLILPDDFVGCGIVSGALARCEAAVDDVVAPGGQQDRQDLGLGAAEHHLT